MKSQNGSIPEKLFLVDSWRSNNRLSENIRSHRIELIKSYWIVCPSPGTNIVVEEPGMARSVYILYFSATNRYVQYVFQSNASLDIYQMAYHYLSLCGDLSVSHWGFCLIELGSSAVVFFEIYTLNMSAQIEETFTGLIFGAYWRKVPKYSRGLIWVNMHASHKEPSSTVRI